MSAQHESSERGLAIEIEPDLRRRIESAAAERGMSVRDYVVGALRDALEQDQALRDSEERSRLSVPSFARDWDSDADAIYDDLTMFNRGLREALAL